MCIRYTKLVNKHSCDIHFFPQNCCQSFAKLWLLHTALPWDLQRWKFSANQKYGCVYKTYIILIWVVMGETATHCEHRASSLVAAGVWKAHCGEKHGEDVYCVHTVWILMLPQPVKENSWAKWEAYAEHPDLGCRQGCSKIPEFIWCWQHPSWRGYCIVGVGIQPFFTWAWAEVLAPEKLQAHSFS